MTPARFELSGIRIDAVQIPDVIDAMEAWIRSGVPGHYVVAANAHVVTEAQRDPVFREAVKAASLTLPDSMPLVWVARAKGFALRERAYGPDLMADFFEATQSQKYRHFLYGGTDEVLQALIKNLRVKFPAVEICGSFSPPFRELSEEEDKSAVKLINDTRPDIVWVGTGCPRQELWMYRHRNSLNAPVMVGVGQAFDLLADMKKRAPKWMQRSGLEWLFRLIREPRRLGFRYLMGNTRFVGLVLKALLNSEFSKKRATNHDTGAGKTF